MRLEHTFTVPVPVEQAWRALLDPERVAPCFPGATLTGVDDAGFSGTVKVRLGPVALLYRGTGRFAATDEAARRLVLEAGGKDSRGNGTAQATVTATLTPTAGAGAGGGGGGAGLGGGTAGPGGNGSTGAGPGPAGTGATRVDVVTELTITGKPAQLGRGLVGEVGGKILNAFAGCLADRLAEPPEPASQPQLPVAAGAADGAATPAARSAVASRSTATPSAVTPSAVTRSGVSRPAVAADRAGSPRSAAEHARPVAVARPPGTAEEIDLIQLAGRPVLRRLAPVAAVLLAVLLIRRWLHHRH
jgi:carbon monoxide dehydrogenase subunit G